MDSELSGRTAGLILNAALGNQMTTPMYEGLCAGNSQWLVQGIAVCYAPSLEVLRRAAAQRKTLVLCREHPFFLHGGYHYAYGTDGLDAVMKDDPVVNAKREIINSSQLLVHRMGGAWDHFRPRGQSQALARALGLASLQPSPADRSRGVICDLPRTSVQDLAQLAADRLKTRHPRIVGDPQTVVTRVAVLAGEADPTPGLASLLSDPKIDGVIAGAGGVVDEVDGAIGYFQDVVGSGRKIAMLTVGYASSHDPGVGEMARWLVDIFPGRPVEYWPTSDPSWIPR